MNALLGGDWRFFWPENVRYFTGIPQAWDASLNTGVGQPALNTLWITSYLNFSALFQVFGLSWNAISLIFWILPVFFITFFSAFYLFKYIFKTGSFYAFVAGFIYCTNTYFLLIFFGGQLGVAFAYSLIPLVLLRFIKVFYAPNIYNGLFAGLVISLQILFDPRIVYLTSGIIFLYWLLAAPKKFLTKQIINGVFLSIGIFLLLHNYWIFPMFLFKLKPIPSNFNSIDSLRFFSFADFSHSLSLLHPNWPENIFGKIYFMNPMFLIVPVLAFSSLLFINKSTGWNVKKLKSSKTNQEKNSKFEIRNSKQIRNQNNKLQNEYIIEYKNILFFALLGLTGAFMAKGANEPFGKINIWIFSYIPGMSLFRDPTKWYMLVAISYSILIPFALSNIGSRLLTRFKIRNPKIEILDKSKIINVQNSLIVLFIIVWSLLHGLTYFSYPVKGMIKSVPREYVQLKDFLFHNDAFYRTLWIPQWQRFGYFSPMQPAIGRGELIDGINPIKAARLLNQDKIIPLLREYSVRYVIVPYDSEGEIFISDRKYDDSKYKKIVAQLDSIPWLRREKNFGKIIVYKLPDYKDHFWLQGSKREVQWTFISPTNYKVQFKNSTMEQLLVFSDTYNPYWSAYADGRRIGSKIYNGSYNSFKLPENTNKVDVYYEPQRWVNIGLLVSSISLLSILLTLIYLHKKR